MGSARFSLFMLASLFLFTSFIHLIHAKCLNDQRSYMLQFREGLQIDPPGILNWNRSTDCCEWSGVGCDGFGLVISLDLGLDSGFISIGNETWKALFSLHHLQRLSLALHSPPTNIPMEIYNLTRLQYLNFSGFSGPIPLELSKLYSLVTLDLSRKLYDQDSLQVSNNGGLKMLLQNLTSLRELYLDGVRVHGWNDAFSSSPQLQVLSSRRSQLSGRSFFLSLSNLTLLSTIKLDDNALKTSVPDFFANFTNLQILSLRNCELHGKFPKGSVFHELIYLDLSSNNFSGSIPSFQMSPKLARVDMSHNAFTGSISSVHFEGLTKLEYVDLKYNSMSGNLPKSLFSLPSLRYLQLSHNHFDGEIEEIQNGSSSLLEQVDLNNNNLSGFLPKFFFELQRLAYLDIESNSFTGTLSLDMFTRFQDLWRLKLSHNNLSIDASCSYGGCLSSIQVLGLASCNLQMFPDLRNQTRIVDLDLSLNNIIGEVPNWLWQSSTLSKVNLSLNRLDEIQKPFTINHLESLDLCGNLFKGEIPLQASDIRYLDYSHNNFNTTIPSNISEYIPNIAFLSLSNNSIHGQIPESLCNCSILNVVDLSHNFLTGAVPSCLPALIGVLNLRENKLSGTIPDTFDIYCPLEFLDLSRNNLTGKIPKSLANCTYLQIVNVGDNSLDGSFPCTLTNGSYLGILILRSNRLYGEINCSWDHQSWPNLQILDISYNNFNSVLPDQLLLHCRGMMTDNDTSAQLLQYAVSEFYSPGDYQDSVSLIIKGLEFEIYKILTILKIIDFSSNDFEGQIPDSIGQLRGLYSLNMSNNALTGTIPESIGKLKQLGSLDLSTNELSGRIPSEVGDLTFLSVLNVSYNQLFGKIPSGGQLQTFSESSFLGNKGLCGFPLNLSCDHEFNNNKSSSSRGPTEIDWVYVSAALGFSVGLGIIALMNWLSPVWWRKFNALILRFLIEQVISVPKN